MARSWLLEGLFAGLSIRSSTWTQGVFYVCTKFLGFMRALRAPFHIDLFYSKSKGGQPMGPKFEARRSSSKERHRMEVVEGWLGGTVPSHAGTWKANPPGFFTICVRPLWYQGPGSDSIVGDKPYFLRHLSHQQQPFKNLEASRTRMGLLVFSPFWGGLKGNPPTLFGGSPILKLIRRTP